MESNYRFDPNNYEFNKNSKNGIYIIHGFSSTTYEVKQLSEFLGNSGFHAVANNLPGHGTTVSQCNRVRYTDWLEQIKQDMAILSSQSEKIFVLGCSMGAVLALYAASVFPVKACIVGSTVLKFKNQFTIDYINRFICKIFKIRKKKDHIDKQKRQNKIKFYGYQEYPLIALNEFRKLNKLIKKKLKNVTCPTLVIHSNNDRLSLLENMDLVFDNIKSTKKKKMLVENAHHNLFDENNDQDVIFQKILKFLREN